MTKSYLLFDAGGTLVFPDFDYLANQAVNFGIQVNASDLFQSHCQMILDLDVRSHEMGHLADPFPNGYTKTLFKGQVHDPVSFKALIDTIEDRNRLKSLWTSTFPWVKATLDELKSSGYRMAVISNSDGRVDQILEDLDLKPYFDQVFDSHILGVSKPDKRIFQTALESLRLLPEDAIYIGDVFFIDVWGANQAGLGCIHLDPGGLYTRWPGVHIPTIAQLPAWLSESQVDDETVDLFPAFDLNITY